MPHLGATLFAVGFLLITLGPIAFFTSVKPRPHDHPSGVDITEYSETITCAEYD